MKVGTISMIDWNIDVFHPVVNLPKKCTVLDLSGGLWALENNLKSEVVEIAVINPGG